MRQHHLFQIRVGPFTREEPRFIALLPVDFLNRHKIEFRLEHLFEDEHHGCLLLDLRADAHS